MFFFLRSCSPVSRLNCSRGEGRFGIFPKILTIWTRGSLGSFLPLQEKSVRFKMKVKVRLGHLHLQKTCSAPKNLWIMNSIVVEWENIYFPPKAILVVLGFFFCCFFLNLHPVTIHLNHSQYSRPYWEQKSICIKPEMFIRWNFFKTSIRFMWSAKTKLHSGTKTVHGFEVFHMQIWKVWHEVVFKPPSAATRFLPGFAFFVVCYGKF